MGVVLSFSLSLFGFQTCDFIKLVNMLYLDSVNNIKVAGYLETFLKPDHHLKAFRLEGYHY